MPTIKRGLIIDFNSVAAMLAHEGADVQAAFFNTFAKELHSCCETSHAVEMQATFIAAELTERAKEVAETFCFKEANK